MTRELRRRWRPTREAVLAAVYYDGDTEARAIGRTSWTPRRAAGSRPSNAQVVSEAGGWSVFISGLPVAADGASFDEAITEMADALRENADGWQRRLLNAPNHRGNWGLVQLISLSDDVQLREGSVRG
ncbi:prevent-host-death protein [Actinomycetes bacterium KLBMP 9759]